MIKSSSDAAGRFMARRGSIVFSAFYIRSLHPLPLPLYAVYTCTELMYTHIYIYIYTL